MCWNRSPCSSSSLCSLITRLRELRIGPAPSTTSPHRSLSDAISPTLVTHEATWNRQYLLGSLSRVSAATSISTYTPIEHDEQPGPHLSQLAGPLCVSPSTHDFLVANYQARIGRLYPVLESTDIQPATEEPAEGSGYSTASVFTRYMVYALSCESLPRHHRLSRTLAPLSSLYFAKAMECYQQATIGVNVASLRALALLALYGLFSPDKTNVTQAVAQVSRLCIDLNIHESQEKSYQRLYLSMLCIERQLCLALDRPWLLPDAVGSNIRAGLLEERSNQSSRSSIQQISPANRRLYCGLC